MFDIFSWQHIFILLVIALVVVGPKDLPPLMNKAGKWAGKARAMVKEVRQGFDELVRQNELDELRAEINAMKKNNPLSDIQKPIDDINSALAQPPVKSGATGTAPAATSSSQQSGPELRSGDLGVPDAPPDHRPPSLPAAS